MDGAVLVVCVGIVGVAILCSACALAFYFIPELRFWETDGAEAQPEVWKSAPSDRNKKTRFGCEFHPRAYNDTKGKWACHPTFPIDTGLRSELGGGFHCTATQKCKDAAVKASKPKGNNNPAPAPPTGGGGAAPAPAAPAGGTTGGAPAAPAQKPQCKDNCGGPDIHMHDDGYCWNHRGVSEWSKENPWVICGSKCWIGDRECKNSGGASAGAAPTKTCWSAEKKVLVPC